MQSSLMSSLRKDRAAVSRADEQFVPHQMKAHGGKLGLVEEIGRYRLAHIGAQLLPGVSLSEDVVRKTLGHIASITLLRHAKDNF